MDGRSFVFSCEAHLIIVSVYFDMFFYDGSEGFADFFKHFAISATSHDTIREICMHPATIPVEIAKRFAMPVYGHPIFFTDPFQQVTGYPYFISCSFCSLGKDLEL